MKRFQGRIPLVNTFGKASLHPVDGTPVATDDNVDPTSAPMNRPLASLFPLCRVSFMAALPGTNSQCGRDT